MFGRICAFATLLPTILAAQEDARFHPYARADIGMARYMEVDAGSDTPDEFESIEDDLRSAFEFSVAGGLTGPRKSIGFGIVFQRDASEGETSGGASVDVEDVSVSNISAELTSTLVGVQALFLHELSPKVLLRGEIGLAKATTEQTIRFDADIFTGTSYVPASSEMTIEGEGAALLMGAGLDLRLTPNISVGAMLNLVSGTATPESGEMTMQALGQTRTAKADGDDLDEMGDQDISSFGLSGGVRVLF